jgi:hypothetical protein
MRNKRYQSSREENSSFFPSQSYIYRNAGIKWGLPFLRFHILCPPFSPSRVRIFSWYFVKLMHTLSWWNFGGDILVIADVALEPDPWNSCASEPLLHYSTSSGRLGIHFWTPNLLLFFLHISMHSNNEGTRSCQWSLRYGAKQSEKGVF